MAYNKKWKPSRAAAKAYAAKIDEIATFCEEHGIISSRTNDSYYFTVNGQKYRVSNHSVESSNKGAYNELYGRTRALYHENGREDDTIYIHAGKTRIIDIYNDLTAGYTLDGHGNRI